MNKHPPIKIEYSHSRKRYWKTGEYYNVKRAFCVCAVCTIPLRDMPYEFVCNRKPCPWYREK